MPILIGSAARARRRNDGAAAKALPATAYRVAARRVMPVRSVMSFLPVTIFPRPALADLEPVGQESTVSAPLQRYLSRRMSGMRIPDAPIDPARIARFIEEGYWVAATSNDALEQRACDTPGKLAIADGRVAFGYAEYYRRAERLAAHFALLGLGADDVIAIQLPNWSEFPVAVNAAMLAGIPFCQFHSDFRSRE